MIQYGLGCTNGVFLEVTMSMPENRVSYIDPHRVRKDEGSIHGQSAQFSIPARSSKDQIEMLERINRAAQQQAQGYGPQLQPEG